MSEEAQGPKELREAYDRMKQERDELLGFKRSTLLEKAGVPSKAHGAVIKILGDDAPWEDAESISSTLAEQGLSFGDTNTGESGGPPPPSPEDTERIAAQQRTQALMAAGMPVDSTPSTPNDKFAAAEAGKDVRGMFAANAEKLLGGME